MGCKISFHSYYMRTYENFGGFKACIFFYNCKRSLFLIYWHFSSVSSMVVIYGCSKKSCSTTCIFSVHSHSAKIADPATAVNDSYKSFRKWTLEPNITNTFTAVIYGSSKISCHSYYKHTSMLLGCYQDSFLLYP